MVFVYAIIGKSSEPLYELELSPTSSSGSGGHGTVSASASQEELAYLHQFVLHSSLDMVQSSMWSNTSKYVNIRIT